MYVVNQYWYLKKCYIIITFKTCPQGTIPEYVSLGHTRKALKCYVAKYMWKPEDNSTAFLSPRGKHSSIITVIAMCNINCKQCFIRVLEIFTSSRGPRCRVYFSPQTVFVI